MDNMILNKLQLILEETANITSREDRDDFLVVEEVGGNVDAAYELGKDEGEIGYARHLLAVIDLLKAQELELA